MRTTILALALGSATAAIGHVRELRTSGLPSIFTVPELRVSHPDFSALHERALASGEAVTPATHGTFVGTTDVGFIDFTCVPPLARCPPEQNPARAS